MKPTQEMNDLLMKMGSKRRSDSLEAAAQIAVALEMPLRKGVLSGDIVGDIFERVTFAPGVTPEFPLDLLAPGTEKDHVAYTISFHGGIPERSVESDYVTVPTFDVGNSIDWLLRYAEEARWDVVNRALQVMEAGFIKKHNDDGWHVILAGAVDRNIMVYDNAANAGQFTKRLVSLMKTVMRRNGGGNSTSVNRGKLTDLYISPEGMEDIRDWGVDQVDEVTRREIFTAEDGRINRIFSVNLHDIDEFGVSQEYQNFFTSDLSGSLETSDVELVVGLDLSNNDSFMWPVKKEIEIFEDETLHRKQRAGYYSWERYGVMLADNRRCIAASF
ncbi:hypothetical protein H8D36_06595 [archaeon]|nr:hypothetical protein [archaeon]